MAETIPDLYGVGGRLERVTPIMPPSITHDATPATADELDAVRRLIDPADLTFTFTRSGGPGGQNVNKVNTRVTLWFDLDGCDTLTPTEKRKIRTRLHGRITKNGCVRVVASRYRTQRANRTAVIERLMELLAIALRRKKTRKPTKVPPGAKRRRMADKRLTGEKKRQRTQRPTASDGW